MSETQRNKCGACYKQYNRKDHLVDHMRTSYHSLHEPKCAVCNKHCRSFESLREHLTGMLPKAACNSIFSNRGCGCDLCLAIFSSPNALMAHRRKCQLPPINFGLVSRLGNIGIIDKLKPDGPKVVALACKMVGGGSDGSMDLCARVCLIDEHENIIFHTYVKPPVPITNYRYESTGIRAEMLREAMPLWQVKTKIESFVCNGEPVWKIRSGANKGRIVVGHGLDHDLAALQIDYPPSMLRDAAKYPPLVKSNKICDSLKELTKTYLGYDMYQTGGVRNPYEDCVAAMRIYMRLKSQVHGPQQYGNIDVGFGSRRQAELEKMTPQELLAISTSDYYCWCLDSYYKWP